MALLTPPPTLKKTAGFFKPYTRQAYHEDIYGTRNPDEELDVPDVCESESDSDDEEALQQAQGGYSSFLSTEGAADGPQEAFANQEAITFDGKEPQYRVVPHLNAKRSIPVADTKKLMPKKFGMFAAYDPLDTTVVPDVESGHDEEDVTRSIRDRGEGGSIPRPVQDTIRSRSSQGGLGNPLKRPVRQKRKGSSVTIERAKARRLISQEIAEHARERKAALRSGRAAQGQKAAKRLVPLPTGPVRQPIVSGDCSEDELNSSDAESRPRARSRREILQSARDARANGRGGHRGQAASTRRDKSFREVGYQKFEELVKQKLWVMGDNSDLKVEDYVRH